MSMLGRKVGRLLKRATLSNSHAKKVGRHSVKSRPTQCEKSADAKVARKVARVNAALGLDINTKHTNLQTLGRQHKERQGEAKGPVRTVPQA